MKFRTLVGAVASVALFASAAAAQVCQGDLSFRGRPMHVSGALGITDNTTTFGGGLLVGHTQGWYGGGSLSLMNADGAAGSGFVLGGGVGYSMALQQRSRWQVCPGATLSLGFGPDVDLGGTHVDVSTRTFTLGASIGTTTPLSKSVTLIPYGSLALANTNFKASSGGVSGSTGDTYAMLGFGAGFQFSPTLVLRPSLSFNLDSDIMDETIFSLGVTFALPHGQTTRRK